jgi:hypothetical protein
MAGWEIQNGCRMEKPEYSPNFFGRNNEKLLAKKSK